MCAYLVHRPVQLGLTYQECETPTDIAPGATEARKPSHHFKVHAPGDGSPKHEARLKPAKQHWWQARKADVPTVTPRVARILQRYVMRGKVTLECDTS